VNRPDFVRGWRFAFLRSAVLLIFGPRFFFGTGASWAVVDSLRQPAAGA